MLGRFFAKILGRNQGTDNGVITVATHSKLGLKRIGVPTTKFLQVVTGTVAETCGPDFRSDAVRYYAERVFCKWIPTLIEDSYSDRQLAALAPETLRSAYLALLWDMLRHNKIILWDSPDDGDWVTNLCCEIARRSHTQYPDIFADNHVFDIHNIDNDQWAEDLGKFLGVPGVKLFFCHSALVAGVVEMVESTKPKVI
ncbi:hypothetical protein [Budvicia diplopodorum]|uniref:hypothetical protein n=1 Tax=Budvicia diplopodorum TaxID=1119056 RepID=UPI001358E4DF|nr:hypothetical protein [Budvicia diplopodorum]